MTAKREKNKVIAQHSHFVESPFSWLEGTGQCLDSTWGAETCSASREGTKMKKPKPKSKTAQSDSAG